MEIIDSYMNEGYKGYYFTIEFNDGTTINDDATELNIKELHEFDKLTMDTAAFNNYLSSVSSRYNKDLFDIKAIRIGYKKKSLEYPIVYALVNNNPYVKNVIDYIYAKEVYGVNNFKQNQYVIKSESPDYSRMKEYMLNELRNDPEEFINRYFSKTKVFKGQLYNYAMLYKDEFKSSEDDREMYRLQRNITEELAIYKVYRSLAVKRYYYEKDKYKIYDQQKQSRSQIELEKRINTMTTEEAKTDDFNQKYDEYLEPGEYDQMTGYTGERVK